MKMSKSDPSDMSRINLTDDADAIAQKIRKARTDPEPLPDDPALLAARPEARNLVGVLAALTNETEAAICARFAGQGFGAFKPALTEALVELLSPLRARLVELRRDEAQIDAFLAAGATAPPRSPPRRSPAPIARSACAPEPRPRVARPTRSLHRLFSTVGVLRELQTQMSSLKGLVFMRKFKIAMAFALGVSALALSGCATGFPAQVSRYQAMPAPQGQSFIVVPMDARAIGGLEFSRYAGMVAQAMQAQGYVPAAVDGDRDDGRARRLWRRPGHRPI